MPTRTRRSAVCLAASILLVGLVGGCATSRTGEPSTATSAAATTVAPTTTTVPPMTDEELAWLQAIPAVSMKVEKSMAAITDLTSSGMAKLGIALRSCTRDLVNGGSPSERLQPVFVLVTKACKEYNKGAACFATAAKIGIPVAGTQADRDQTKAIDCGFSAPGNGAFLLADAEAMGVEIKGEAG
jgi:hypothetical protein